MYLTRGGAPAFSSGTLASISRPFSYNATTAHDSNRTQPENYIYPRLPTLSPLVHDNCPACGTCQHCKIRKGVTLHSPPPISSMHFQKIMPPKIFLISSQGWNVTRPQPPIRGAASHCICFLQRADCDQDQVQAYPHWGPRNRNCQHMQ